MAGQSKVQQDISTIKSVFPHCQGLHLVQVCASLLENRHAVALVAHRRWGEGVLGAPNGGLKSRGAIVAALISEFLSKGFKAAGMYIWRAEPNPRLPPQHLIPDASSVCCVPSWSSLQAWRCLHVGDRTRLSQDKLYRRSFPF
eukprot:1161153-Pelagomonas_calceolata.AAC.6